MGTVVDKTWFSLDDVDRLEALLVQAEAEGWRQWIRTRSDYSAVLDGCYFDIDKAERFRTFCAKFVVQVNGRWKGKPFILLPWQWEHVIAPLFGWMTAAGVRRHRKAFIFIAKKNGKSALSAAIQLYMLVGDGENGANCYCAALDRKQAGLVWGEAAKYVKASPNLRKVLGVFAGTKRIVFERTSSFVAALSADKDSSEGIDAHCVVYDELHMAKTDAMYDILKYAGSARDQSLFLVITTAGSSTNTICHKEYVYAKRVRDGEIVDTSYLPCVFEAPLDADAADPETWKQANPSIGSIIQQADLALDYKQAIETGKLANFRRRRLNQWCEDEKGWVSADRWNACRGEISSEALDLPCWFGLDLGNTSDLNALVMVWKGEDKVYVKPRIWIPDETLRDRINKGHAFFHDWVARDWLTVVDGATMDFDLIEQAIVEEASNVQLREIAYDQWQAAPLVNHLITKGLPMVKVPQIISQLSAGMKEVERLILAKDLVHDGNEVMAWMVSNTVTKSDVSGNIRPSKDKSADKIDGVSALVTAMARVVVNGGEKDSVYDLPEDQRVVFI